MCGKPSDIRWKMFLRIGRQKEKYITERTENVRSMKRSGKLENAEMEVNRMRHRISKKIMELVMCGAWYWKALKRGLLTKGIVGIRGMVKRHLTRGEGGR